MPDPERAASASHTLASGREGPDADPLTGLPGRAALQRRLLARKPPGSGSGILALLQLANFYEIRHWVGKSEADCLLSEVAAALGSALPSGASLFRCDHFEFAVLLEASGAGYGGLLAERLRSAVRLAGKDLIPPQLTLHCVVGVARRAGDSLHPDILFARARQNLSRALPGRDSENVFPAQDCSADRASLAAALAEGGLEPAFQPLLYWRDTGERHFEMRCRLRRGRQCWQGEPLFETAVSHALGEALDRAAVLAAMSRLSAARPPTLSLTVNLTLGSLVSSGFLSWLGGLLGRNPAVAGRLCLQLSEIDLLIGQHHAEHFSRGLAGLGLSLAVRHFGCFEDPLGYLSLLRCARVRLDASLARTLGESAELSSRLEELLAALAARKIEVVVGMQEDLGHLPRLWQTGVAAVQGYCIAAPAPEPDFAYPGEIILA